MLKHNTEYRVNPKRAVIMGAGGFIGSALVKRLSKKSIPHEALTPDKLDLLASNSSEQLTELLRPEDTLVIISAIAPCKDNQMLLKNIAMMASVCAAIEKSPPKHVIYISSDAVYADDTKPLTETSFTSPSSLHGAMHLTREIMLKSICTIPLAILRPTLIYGVGDTHDGYGPNRFHRLASEGKTITLFGEGEELRDHVYIEDVVEIIRLVITRKSAGVLNIATGIVTSFYNIAKMVASQFDAPVIIKQMPRKGPMPHNGYRPFDIAACRNAFPSFKYLTINEGLKRMNEKKRDGSIKERIGAVILLREDGAALLQLRDNNKGLRNAGMWVPPGGHAECGEPIEMCAQREFLEETEYYCPNLHWLTEFEDSINGWPSYQLTVFWDIYDGIQKTCCREGQVLEFIRREDAIQYNVPEYLIKIWDMALHAMKKGRISQ